MPLHFDISHIDEPDEDDKPNYSDFFDDEEDGIEDEKDCFFCCGSGEGYIPEQRCSYCNGRGTIKKKKY